MQVAKDANEYFREFFSNLLESTFLKFQAPNHRFLSSDKLISSQYSIGNWHWQIFARNQTEMGSEIAPEEKDRREKKNN